MKAEKEWLSVLFNPQKKKKIILLFMLIIYSFLGCTVSRPLYPKEWSPIVKNAPLESYSGQYNVMLLNILGRESFKNKDLNNCLTEFWISDNQELMFRLKCKNDFDTIPQSSFALKLPDAKIVIKKKEDGILINFHYQSVAGDVLVGPRREYVFLSIAQDGSLVVKKGFWGYGLVMLLIPSGVNEFTWYRFFEDKVEIVKGKN